MTSNVTQKVWYIAEPSDTYNYEWSIKDALDKFEPITMIRKVETGGLGWTGEEKQVLFLRRKDALKACEYCGYGKSRIVEDELVFIVEN